MSRYRQIQSTKYWVDRVGYKEAFNMAEREENGESPDEFTCSSVREMDMPHNVAFLEAR